MLQNSCALCQVCVCRLHSPALHHFCHIGKVKKELDHDDSHLNLDETTRLLQDLHEAQAERGGSRPSSNLSSLSTASEREQHPPGKGLTGASRGACMAKMVASTQGFILRGLHPCASVGPGHFVFYCNLLPPVFYHSIFYSLTVLINGMFIFYWENM